MLLTSMLLQGTITVVAESNNIDSLEKERQETLDAIDDLKESIDTTQKKIASLENEKNNIQSYINQLDKESNTITKQINEFEEKVNEKITDIEETQSELEDAEKRCAEQNVAMKKRMQYMYESNNTSLLEVLCSNGSLSDMLNKADMVLSVSSYDRDMLNKYITTKNEVAEKQEILEAELEELEIMKDELNSQKTKITSIINQKKGELSSKTESIGDEATNQKDYEKQLEEQEKLLNEIEDQIAKAAQPDVFEGSTTGFIWPCPNYTRISSYFGPRSQPTAGASTNHKGVDLAAPYGSSILASASGVVTTSKYSASAGNYVVIAHGNGISTVYMHCSSLLVSVGDVVSQGDAIAKVGSTGYSTGNHLHFGVIKNGTYVDPLGYI